MTDTTQVGDALRILIVDDDLLVPFEELPLLAGASGTRAKDAMNSNEELKAANEEVLS